MVYLKHENWGRPQSTWVDYRGVFQEKYQKRTRSLGHRGKWAEKKGSVGGPKEGAAEPEVNQDPRGTGHRPSIHPAG